MLMTPPAHRVSRPTAARTAPRAPRREGARTTLRVPDDLAATVVRYAAQHRTSTNDALVRLAYDGAARFEREREIAELAAARLAAIEERALREPLSGVEPLSGEEVVNAILGFRLGLYDEDEFGA